ncbi:MAG: hypothetical protein WA919_14250 [Coleofasciculaceae cyanobacterium]
MNAIIFPPKEGSTIILSPLPLKSHVDGEAGGAGGDGGDKGDKGVERIQNCGMQKDGGDDEAEGD